MADKIQEVTVYLPTKDMILGEEAVDLAEGGTRLRRKIAAITEGTHNQITFEKDEIEKAITATTALAQAEGRTELVPAVIDHCDGIECLIGAATKLSSGKVKTPEGKSVPAAIFEVDYDEDTERQKAAVAIIRKHPQLVMNSIRARGKIAEDEKGALFIKDFVFVHLGHVLDPADRNAKGLDQGRSWSGSSCPRDLKRETEPPADFPLNTADPDATGMGEHDQARIQELEGKVADLTAKTQDLEQKIQDKDAELTQARADLEAARKEPVVAAILAMKSDFSEDLLKGMTHTQLQALQVELTAIAPAPGTRNTSKGSATGGAPGGQTELTAEQKADALFGAL